MALPHYKPHTYNAAEATTAYPVLLAPTETPSRWGAVKQFFFSHKLLFVVELIAVVACASLLWVLLDPSMKNAGSLYFLTPAIILGICIFLFGLISMINHRADYNLSSETNARQEITHLPATQVKALLPRTAVRTELRLEQWSSEPFLEIMDEAVLAEVFNDDMVAPDHIVFSVKVVE